MQEFVDRGHAVIGGSQGLDRRDYFRVEVAKRKQVRVDRTMADAKDDGIVEREDNKAESAVAFVTAALDSGNIGRTRIKRTLFQNRLLPNQDEFEDIGKTRDPQKGSERPCAYANGCP
jgi:hypothetical protein